MICTGAMTDGGCLGIGTQEQVDDAGLGLPRRPS